MPKIATGNDEAACMAGTYSRMLIKTATFNQLRNDHSALQRDYVDLRIKSQQREVQAASLSALASEVSALYGLTSKKIAEVRLSHSAKGAVASAGMQSVADIRPIDESYTHSLDAFGGEPHIIA